MVGKFIEKVQEQFTYRLLILVTPREESGIEETENEKLLLFFCNGIICL